MLMTRYLLKNLVNVTVFVALTLAAVIWLTQSLKLLELVASTDAPLSLFLKLVAMTMPRFLEIILPLSLVTAVLFVYHKMIMDNELIVLRSCGFDQFTLARPALILAGCLTVFLLLLTTYVSPKSHAEVQLMRQALQSEYSSMLLREGVFNTFGKNLTVYVRKRTREGDLMGILIHDTRDTDKPPVTVTAKKGRLTIQDGVPQIIVYDGMRQQMNAGGENLSKLHFSRYTIEIKGFEGETNARWREANERTFMELLSPDMSNSIDRKNAAFFQAEAHHRIITPFNAVAFTLMALVCILVGPFNRRGQGKKVLVASVLVIALQALNIAVVSSLRKNPDFVPVLYIATLLPVAVGFYGLHLRGEQKILFLLRKLRQTREAMA